MMSGYRNHRVEQKYWILNLFLNSAILKTLKLTINKRCDGTEDHVLLVYQSKLEELFKFCSACGSPIDSFSQANLSVLMDAKKMVYSTCTNFH